MEEYSENLQFEKAAKIRDEIRAVENLGERQKIITGALSDTDIIGIAIGESKCAFSVLHYIDGTLLESEIMLVETPVYADKSELLSDFIKSYYMPKKVLPRSIYLAEDISDRELIGRWLSSLTTHKVELYVPQRGDKAKLTEMATKNAEDKLRITVSDEEKTSRTINDLKKLLGLEISPKRIECYDISNTNGENQVASMVVFENGAPKRASYRKFKIKTLSDQNDAGAHREVVARRMARYTDGDEKFSPLPDVIFLDGGKPQVSAVSALNTGIPVFGLVKDDRHKIRAIINEAGEEIAISASPAVFILCGKISEEVHRTAIAYHRKLRDKTGSSLTKIEGVGELRAKKLLKTFGSIKALKEAEVSEIARIVPRNIAEKIKESLK